MKEKTKEKRTPKQRFMIFLRILLIIVLVLGIIFAILACVNMIGNKSNSNFISTLEPVEYTSQLEPVADEDGCYTFTTDNDLRVMQLTDVHMGGGFMSIKKDNMAINAVAAMIRAEKPDLVVISGDIAYPVPFQAGTFNNKSSAKLFAQLMEQLGVYWCPCFGNHDTEIYSFYSREKMAEFYSDERLAHCLFSAGDSKVDGEGNYVVNVKNTKGEITQSLFMIDSHSYVDGDYFGALWKYDSIHENQVDWYENTLKSLEQKNNGVMPKSLAFFHIPLPEYKEAWDEYAANNFKDTENVKYVYGKLGESKEGIYCGLHNYGFFDKVKELGSTQGIFCGHDHLNNFSLEYKGVRLTYGYSVDYLAYAGISKYGLQRGNTMITIHPDGSFDSKLENYYQDKYIAANEKEQVTMDPMKGVDLG